jgi:hypothetical protein
MRAVKKSKINSVVFIFVLVCLVNFPVQAKYCGGTGEPNNPYLISTADQLNMIGLEPNDWDKHFRLIADINLANINYSSAIIPELSGSLDGNGFIVRNLTIIGVDDLGLIGTIHEGGQVRNLGFENVTIDGLGKHLGILAGTNCGVALNCYSSGLVLGDVYVGGLIADNNQGKIINCYNTASVIGGMFIGGLTGFNSGDVTGCYSIGEVCGDYCVGGLAGYSESNTVTNSFWDIETSGQAESAGGTGKTTAEMQSASTFLEAGMDFVDETDNGTEDIWRIDEGLDYPHLSWESTGLYSSNSSEPEVIIVGDDSEGEEEVVADDTVSSGSTEYFTERFTSGADAFDLSYKAVMFTPTTDGTFYSPILSEITQLPTDPVGGTVLDLDDDSYALVNLSALKKVFIFGYHYTRFYVGSNGYITFTHGDTSREDILELHFSTKRISVLFTDLDPTRNGEIKYRQLEDRVVVTWQNVSEFAPWNSNTFQVEMYFDGRIRLAWLDVESENGIVGLSQGQGLPVDFEEADFSAFPKSNQPGEPSNPGTPGSSGRRNRKK